MHTFYSVNKLWVILTVFTNLIQAYLGMDVVKGNTSSVIQKSSQDLKLYRTFCKNCHKVLDLCIVCW